MHMPRTSAPALILFATLGTATLSAILSGCESGPPPRPIQVAPDRMLDVPVAMRGLIGSEVEFRNTSPILVSGYGLIVGLNGSGGLPLNDQVAAGMERQLGLMGVGKANDALRGTALEGKSPSMILRDRNVGVVQVLAAVPPGAPEGTVFDVVVRAVNATSLEGGKLWTTDLRLGPPTTFGQAQSRRLGVARGAVYTNPFASSDPASGGFDGASGRILGGGELVDSLNVVLQMTTPSHGRARSIVSAINSRFPPDVSDRGPIARGRSDSDIEVKVPTRYRRDARSFLNLVQNLQIDQVAPEQYARRYVDEIKNNPENGERLSWSLEGLGERALPMIRELYDNSELIPQIAGLKAGARLNDARSVPSLQEVIGRSQGTVRTEAISLLGKVDAGPKVDQALRALLDDQDLIVRIAAYEALADRAERAQFVYLARLVQQNRDRVPNISAMELDLISRETLPSGMMQGVERRSVQGKFLYDRVRGGVPLIYVSQQGLPRIVVFGDDDAIRLSSPEQMWGGALIIAPGDSAGDIKARYLRPGAREPVSSTVRATITDLVGLLSRKTSPEDPRPGFDMSYSQVVAVLSRLQESGATTHAFATERDRLNAQLLAAENSRDMMDRPETPEDTDAMIIRRGSGMAAPAPSQDPGKPTVVPIVPGDKK
jgi:hypothetical protein